jgi:hypothetical protein
MRLAGHDADRFILIVSTGISLIIFYEGVIWAAFLARN